MTVVAPEVWLRGPIVQHLAPAQLWARPGGAGAIGFHLVHRKRLPSTKRGLIFHAAEHSSRHAGQIVTLTRIVRSSDKDR